MLAHPEMVAPKPKTEQRHPRKNPPMTLHLRIGVRLGVRLGVRRKTLEPQGFFIEHYTYYT